MARSVQPYNWLVIVGIVVAVFGAATAFQAVSAPSDYVTTPTGDVLPDQHFTTTEGKDISLSQFKGKTVLVHYWGTWCPPCVKELPDLLDAVKNNDRAVVIAVSVERNKQTIDNFLTQIHVKPSPNVYFVLDPTSSVVIDKPVNRFPTTVIISPKMAIADHVNGGIDWHGYSF